MKVSDSNEDLSGLSPDELDAVVRQSVSKALSAVHQDAQRKEKEAKDAAAAREYAESPEGLGLDPTRANSDRILAARAASQRAEARRNLADEARALLVEEGALSAEDAATLPDHLALEYSGIERSPEEQRVADEDRIAREDPEAAAELFAKKTAEVQAGADWNSPEEQARRQAMTSNGKEWQS